VQHLVLLSIAGIDDFPYYVAKTAQEEVVAGGAVPSTIVKSTQWHEFAVNPAAVTMRDDQAQVQGLAHPADRRRRGRRRDGRDPDRRRTPPTKTIAGPQTIRLPELTTKLFQDHGERRLVRRVPAQLPAEGVLLAPDDAAVLGPDVDAWLDTPSARSTRLRTVTG
jgi:hypothetical protein